MKDLIEAILAGIGGGAIALLIFGSCVWIGDKFDEINCKWVSLLNSRNDHEARINRTDALVHSLRVQTQCNAENIDYLNKELKSKKK